MKRYLLILIVIAVALLFVTTSLGILLLANEERLENAREMIEYEPSINFYSGPYPYHSIYNLSAQGYEQIPILISPTGVVMRTIDFENATLLFDCYSDCEKVKISSFDEFEKFLLSKSYVSDSHMGLFANKYENGYLVVPPQEALISHEELFVLRRQAIINSYDGIEALILLDSQETMEQLYRIRYPKINMFEAFFYVESEEAAQVSADILSTIMLLDRELFLYNIIFEAKQSYESNEYQLAFLERNLALLREKVTLPNQLTLREDFVFEKYASIYKHALEKRSQEYNILMEKLANIQKNEKDQYIYTKIMHDQYFEEFLKSCTRAPKKADCELSIAMQYEYYDYCLVLSNRDCIVAYAVNVDSSACELIEDEFLQQRCEDSVSTQVS